MSKAAELASLASASETALSNRNIVINGAMQISQRSTSVAISSVGYHTLDRWRTALSGLGSWTQTQSTDVPTGAGFASSLKMDCTSADASPAAGDYLQVATRIEGQDVQRLKYGTSSAESMVLSFWVKSTKTGVNVVSFYQDDGAKQISGSYTIGTSNTWEYKTITFVGNTVNAIVNDNSRGFQVAWYLGAGSNRTSGTLRTTWTAYATADEAVGQVNNADSTSNDWLITGVQLEVGPVATPFEHRSYGQELALCQRYFYGHVTGNLQVAYNGGFYGNNSATGHVYFKVPMRAAPTPIKVTGADYFLVYAASDVVYLDGDISSNDVSVNAAGHYATTDATRTAGFACRVRSANAAARLGYDAEL